MAAERRYRRWLRLRPQSGSELEREIDDEIEAHLEMRTREFMARGQPVERARAEAVRRFGDYPEARRQLIRTHRAQHERARRLEWLDALRRDCAYAWRRISRGPGAAFFAIATFALGIGLSTATFTIVDAVMFRSLPFPDADRLVVLQSVSQDGSAFSSVSAANWVDWREGNRTLESTALYRSVRQSIRVGPDAVRAWTAQVSGQFFQVLQPRLLIGRPITVADEQARATVAVVSEGFWRRVLGEDRTLAEPLTVEGYSFTVIGVVRALDVYPSGTEVWFPASYGRGSGITRNWINYNAFARLAPGIIIEQADRDLDAIAGRIRSTDPAGIYSFGVGVIPLKDEITSTASDYLGLLLGAVGFVLLIACANLAGINLARGVARKREMAVRLALGAGRGALLRQVLLEHLLLAALGGLLGVAFAYWGVRAIVRVAAEALPRAHEVTLDLRVLGVAAALTAAAGLLTGLWPALRLSSTSLRQQMGSARGEVGGGRQTPGAVLVGVEVALALVLLTGGGLLLRSYQTLIDRPLGFNVRNVIAAQVDLAPAQYRDPARAVQYWQDLEARLRALPGVASVGAANWAPLGRGGTTFLDIEGRADPNEGAGYRAVTDGYFRALGVRLQSGRSFNTSDDVGTLRVTVINRTMAELYWPGQNPIGRRIRASAMESVPNGPPPAWLTIVGVVSDVRHFGPETEIRPEMYTSFRQIPYYAYSMTAIIQASRSAQRLIPAVREQLRQLDRTTPADITTQQHRLADTLRWRRLLLGVLTGFGSLALLLAALGVYSLLSFSVAQRTREIAVRAALGARRSNLLHLILRQAMAVVLVGSAAGLAAALGLTRLMTSLLVDVSPLDPVTFVGVTLFLIAVAALAAALPALRATRLDPLLALQSE